MKKSHFQKMKRFDGIMDSIFKKIKLKNIEKNLLLNLNDLLLSKMTKVETEKTLEKIDGIQIIAVSSIAEAIERVI